MFESFTQLKIILLSLIAVLNFLSFSLFYRDKKRAIKHQRRISERNLLLSTYLFGGIGAYFGMKMFRHKTKHQVFKISVPIAAIFTLALIFLILVST